MLFGNGGNGSMIVNQLVRHFSKKRAVNVRKINPRVSPQVATTIAQDIYNVIKQHGALTIPNTWIQAKEAAINGLESKTHLKLMLKWMRGRNLLRLFCKQVGSSKNASKKFYHCTLPEDPEAAYLTNSVEPELEIKKKPSTKKAKKAKTKKEVQAELISRR
ncbi:hypothetical protein GIB67_005143 [Kingdonia uniflora]|uniref:Uncharacterized protein n=1 Tax=Kingdonia uniflora TaxID=39325 RepID=A0A7J7MPB2_9MAGN|nr:hypothetical protein GIB67_033248 [Kingdonia uniflora]KAF6171018.1 hypothetical protein GIB67_005143 [Kingdonia uniflora]